MGVNSNCGKELCFCSICSCFTQGCWKQQCREAHPACRLQEAGLTAASKCEQPYSTVMTWLRYHLLFSLLAEIQSGLWGEHSQAWSCCTGAPAVDLVVYKGSVPSPQTRSLNSLNTLYYCTRSPWLLRYLPCCHFNLSPISWCTVCCLTCQKMRAGIVQNVIEAPIK